MIKSISYTSPTKQLLDFLARIVNIMSNFSFTSNKREPWTKYVNCGNEYDNNVHSEDVRFICGAHLVIIRIGKIRASNESYPRKMNIITIITHFCNFTLT